MQRLFETRDFANRRTDTGMRFSLNYDLKLSGKDLLLVEIRPYQCGSYGFFLFYIFGTKIELFLLINGRPWWHELKFKKEKQLLLWRSSETVSNFSYSFQNLNGSFALKTTIKMGMKLNTDIQFGLKNIGKNKKIALYTFQDHRTIRSDFCSSEKLYGNTGNRTINIIRRY